jgi:hypothetical protein
MGMDLAPGQEQDAATSAILETQDAGRIVLASQGFNDGALEQLSRAAAVGRSGEQREQSKGGRMHCIHNREVSSVCGWRLKFAFGAPPILFLIGTLL